MSGTLRALFTHTPFRLCLTLWGFGYFLVDFSAAMQGRTYPGVMLLVCLPLLALGVTHSLMLAWLLNRDMPGQAWLKWIAVALATIVAGGIQTFADFAWMRLLASSVFPAWQTWALSLAMPRIFNIYIIYTWTMVLSLALIWTARTSDVAKLNEARASAFEAAASRAEAAALRLQLNPHFLFNTLNGIAGLVVRNKADQAEEMIGRLADFLRSSLAADPTASIPLHREMATIRAYLHIEEARFGDRMRVIYEIEEETLDMGVPSFLLQPLVENAVKHGVAPSRHMSTITISAKRLGNDLILAVTNTGAGGDDRSSGKGLARAPDESGIGLANTRQRLQTLFAGEGWMRAEAVPAGYRCEIGLPDQSPAISGPAPK